MLEIARVVEGLILLHSGIQATEGFVPLNTLCNRGGCERGVATLRFEILRGNMLCHARIRRVCDNILNQALQRTSDIIDVDTSCF